MPDLFKTIFDPFHRLYYVVLIFASVLSYLSYKRGSYKSIFILILLVITVLFELLTSILKENKVHNYIFIYSIFNTIEYTLFGVYYLKACNIKRTKILAKLSIVLFAINSLIVSFLVHQSAIRYEGLFSRNFNIEGLLLFIMYTHLLFTVDDDVTLPVYKHADFWISIGVLVFYGGIFVLFGLYPILLHVDTGKEYGFIIDPLNIFLYISITIGLLCLLRNRKYLTP